jgi:two-component system NtrC family sensor kinase
VEEVCALLPGAAAILIADEALPGAALEAFQACLMQQPLWSDVPILLLTASATATEALWQRLQGQGALGNITLLERPLHRLTLLSTVQVALRARRRQHDLRQLHTTLEQRVTDRTAALAQQTARLQQEMLERSRMQTALAQQEKLAALGTLLANVAHELNNPLAIALMQLDNVQEEGGMGAWRDDLATLRQAVERCRSVVQSFLALARQQPAERQAVALRTVLEEALVLRRQALDEDGITVHLAVAASLPRLWADPHQVQHVVTNLLTNAHYALQQTRGPRHLRLTAAATADRSQVTLTVADTGPGIPADVQHRVFEPFFTTKPQGVGSGLGLPLCRTIVEGHGGQMQLTSQPGQGTTVHVTLPVGTAPAGAAETVPEPPALEPAHRGAILIIDDEPGITQALRRLLARNGHALTTAANGREGLAALAERAYAVILCDMRMPDLDGPGFYREVARRYPHLQSRIIFLTGDVLSPEAEAFFAQDARPRLIKPFKATEVRRMVQQVLETP